MKIIIIHIRHAQHSHFVVRINVNKCEYFFFTVKMFQVKNGDVTKM